MSSVPLTDIVVPPQSCNLLVVWFKEILAPLLMKSRCFALMMSQVDPQSSWHTLQLGSRVCQALVANQQTTVCLWATRDRQCYSCNESGLPLSSFTTQEECSLGLTVQHIAKWFCFPQFLHRLPYAGHLPFENSWLKFWSPNGCVGSNPTSDTMFLFSHRIYESRQLIFMYGNL